MPEFASSNQFKERTNHLKKNNLLIPHPLSKNPLPHQCATLPYISSPLPFPLLLSSLLPTILYHPTNINQPTNQPSPPLSTMDLPTSSSSPSSAPPSWSSSLLNSGQFRGCGRGIGGGRKMPTGHGGVGRVV